MVIGESPAGRGDRLENGYRGETPCAGSIPVLSVCPTVGNLFTPLWLKCECNSAVEYLVANENVEGSNPFIRSFP